MQVEGLAPSAGRVRGSFSSEGGEVLNQGVGEHVSGLLSGGSGSDNPGELFDTSLDPTVLNRLEYRGQLKVGHESTVAAGFCLAGQDCLRLPPV